jgi:surface protein
MIYNDSFLTLQYTPHAIEILPTNFISGSGTLKNFYNNVKSSVIKVPFDTSKITDMSNMFSGCGILATIVPFDTSSVTSMHYMFNNCSSLVTIPQLDTSSVTSMNYMFNNCTSLVTIPQLDTSKVTNMSNMFYGCNKLVIIPQLDTSKVTNMSNMFQNCNNICDIPELDCSSCTSLNTFFGYNNLSYLNKFGGWKNYGMQKSATNVSNVLDKAPYLGKESVLNIINGLYDRKSAGYSVLTLKMHANHLAMLSDEEKAIATNKGWTLS